MIESEPESVASEVERACDRVPGLLSTQAGQAGAETDRDVERVAGGVRRPGATRHTSARAGGLPTGSTPRTAPCAESELGLTCSRTAHAVRVALLHGPSERASMPAKTRDS